jgi:N-acetylmuramoyl-L-alanine amidase
VTTSLLLAALVLASSASMAPAAHADRRPAAALAAAEEVVDVASLRPRIVWKPIPYGERRRQQMAAYSDRHYGRWRWRLKRKLAIVEHYTTGTTWQGAWNTFAANSKHLGEYPGTCAHFIIHTDGTIYQLVPLWIRCRHTIGMNQLSFGIEHVGRSDAEVLGNERQMNASLRLTLWLVAKYGLEIRNVIGHGESLRSPLRFERYTHWRCRTHSDMSGPAMSTYRGRLRDRARAAGVSIGPAPEWVDIGC